MASGKRASMREGPLADLFRKTEEAAEAADQVRDETTADALHMLLRDMHKAYGLTSIIATHNLQLAAACDRVLRLEGGRLIERPTANSQSLEPATP